MSSPQHVFGQETLGKFAISIGVSQFYNGMEHVFFLVIYLPRKAIILQQGSKDQKSAEHYETEATDTFTALRWCCRIVVSKSIIVVSA